MTAAAPTVAPFTEARIIEWDLPQDAADASPGAMVFDRDGTDHNVVWFVTRTGIPRVYKFAPDGYWKKGSGMWTAWQLSDDTLQTGGTKKLRASHDRRYLFVRGTVNLQRVDTQNCDTNSPPTCQLTVWEDQPTNPNTTTATFIVSDLALDDQNNVFSAGELVGGDPTSSYVQMLTPGAPEFTCSDGINTCIDVTRWPVPPVPIVTGSSVTIGGGAGDCESTDPSSPCLSGIAVHPWNANLIYFSEPPSNTIGELNISTGDIRRWDLSQLGVTQPRQLNFNRWGVLWAVTGSGHLVSLDPSCNKITVHSMPAGALNAPWGVAPDDDTIGYTASGTTENKVGMLVPRNQPTQLQPSFCPACTQPQSFEVIVNQERSVVDSGSQPACPKVVNAQRTQDATGDVYVEAFIDQVVYNSCPNSLPSTTPLGITPAKWRAEGTYFYAVGISGSTNGVNRIGFVRLPNAERLKHPRGDHDFDDDGLTADKDPDGDMDTYGVNSPSAGDRDDDGIPDQLESPSAREYGQSDDPTQLQPGQTITYQLTASPTTLALIGSMTTSDLLTPVSVDIVGPLGNVVASSPSAPGSAVATLLLPPAGTYTVRCHNNGATAVTYVPMHIVREPF